MVEGGGQRIFFWLWYKGWFERSTHAGESNLMNEQEPVRKEEVDDRALWRKTQWHLCSGSMWGVRNESQRLLVPLAERKNTVQKVLGFWFVFSLKIVSFY